MIAFLFFFCCSWTYSKTRPRGNVHVRAYINDNPGLAFLSPAREQQFNLARACLNRLSASTEWLSFSAEQAKNKTNANFFKKNPRSSGGGQRHCLLRNSDGFSAFLPPKPPPQKKCLPPRSFPLALSFVEFSRPSTTARQWNAENTKCHQHSKLDASLLNRHPPNLQPCGPLKIEEWNFLPIVVVQYNLA